MKYRPPKFNGKPQWVPITVQNKTWLVGYISGIRTLQYLIGRSLDDVGMELNLNGIELLLDSSRFNNIMENDKRESECTKAEIEKYYQEMIHKKIDLMNDYHPDNDTKMDNFMNVECLCGLGFYTFKLPKDIPDKSLICDQCGRTIIHYNNHIDTDYEYDGDSRTRLAIISEQLDEIFSDEYSDEEDIEDEDDEEDEEEEIIN